MAENYDNFCSYFKNEIVPTLRLLMSIFYSAAALLTTVLNSLILISIWKKPSLHKPSYILIGSLVLSDLLVGAIGEPLMVTYNIAGLNGWSMNDFCVVLSVTKGVIYALGAISLINLTFISLDRLLAVKLRNRYQSVVTQKRVFLFLVTCWIAACGISAALLEYLKLDSPNLKALLLFLGIGTFISILCITVLYSMAFYSLRKITSSSVSPSVQNTEAVARPRSNIDVAKYRKSLVTMIAVSICTILFYTPFVSAVITASVLRYQGIIFSQKHITDKVIWLTALTEFFFLLNSAVNPLLFLWRNRDIREAVKITVKSTLSI